MFLDNALVLDPNGGACDLAFDGTDLALDATPATPMIISLLTNRRARPDDALPQGTTDFYSPASILSRQGWAGDALDATGQLIGSRLWLLQGGKNDTPARKLAESAAAEALEHFQSNNGLVPGVKVVKLSDTMMGIITLIAKTEITLNKVLG